MHEIDLSKYNIRSDLIIENNFKKYLQESYTENNIQVDYVKLNKNNILNKTEGDYITISFEDITDKTNFSNVLSILNKELKRILKLTNIKPDDKVLIVGLGNNKSTPDSLGYEVLKNIIVTRHLFILDKVEGYRNISVLEPNVFGNTGIESQDIIMGVVKETKPDFIIAIDSLAAFSIDRMQRTIQITEEGKAAAEKAKWEQEKEKAVAVTKAQQEFEVAELEAKKAKQVALKVQAEGEAKAAANRALVSAGLTPAEKAEWDYKTAVGIAQALAESKVQWVPQVMMGNSNSSNSAMDAVGLKMLMDITSSIKSNSK